MIFGIDIILEKSRAPREINWAGEGGNRRRTILAGSMLGKPAEAEPRPRKAPMQRGY